VADDADADADADAQTLPDATGGRGIDTVMPKLA